ncbi:MAG: peptidylprolyl isomerase [Paracoccaceae bacterium]
MPKFSSRIIGTMLALTLTSPAFAEEPTAATVVATVNGTEITLGEMIVLRGQLPPEYQAAEDSMLFQAILDQLVNQTALEQSLGDDISTFDKLAVANSRRAYLAGVAVTKAADAAVTDEALQAAYDARFKDTDPGLEYHAAHILVDSKEKADELKTQIDGGADFAVLAKENSSDGAAANGGDLGWFGAGMMVKPFEDAVVAMQAGEVSEPVETQFGWHLVKLFETRAAKIPTLDEMRDELSAELQQKAVEARIAELTTDAAVTRTVEGIDPAVLRDQNLLNQ